MKSRVLRSRNNLVDSGTLLGEPVCTVVKDSFFNYLINFYPKTIKLNKSFLKISTVIGSPLFFQEQTNLENQFTVPNIEICSPMVQKSA